MLNLASIRRGNHLFGSPFRLGIDELGLPIGMPFPEIEPDLPLDLAPDLLEPEPEPEPEPPPPVKTCLPLGKPFVENSICYQMFECKTDGVVTYEKRNSTCPPPPHSGGYYPYSYPYGYLYPVSTPYQVTPSEIVIQDGDKKTDLEAVAPYAIGAIAAAALLYAVLK